MQVWKILLVLQQMVIGANILVMSVFHQKSAWNDAELLKAQPFIEMTGVGIGTDDSVKLKDPEAVYFSLFHAIHDKLFPDVQTADGRSDGITCIADVTAAPDVVRVQNIESQNLPGSSILCDAAVGLLCKKSGTSVFVQKF